MKYGRVDAVHKAMRDYFRAHGCEWEDTSSVGKGFPDAIASRRFEGYPGQSRLALIEIKSGAKARTKPKTAAAQDSFAFRFYVWRIATLADADELIRWLRS